jgi:NADH-quinone oxidoreductase subunit F
MINIFDRSIICGQSVNASLEDALPALTQAYARSSEELLSMIKLSGLCGKGGAGFPAHRKVELMQKQSSDRKYVVINGSEHEPGSGKDRYLLERYPTTVVEGALIMARVVAASEIWISVNVSAPAATAALRAATREITTSKSRLWPTTMPSINIAPVDDSYLVGEESALVAALEKRPALPSQRPPFPSERGLNNLPTLVQNVETIAHLPFIVAHGVQAYQSLGPQKMGVTLCTFGQEFRRPGVQLVPLGVTLSDIVYGYGDGLKSGKSIKAVQPGGPSSGFLTDKYLDVSFDDGSLRRAGSALGCAAIRAFSEDDDMVVFVAEIMEFFSKNCCGQCPACRMETQMLSSIMTQTVQKRGNGALLKQIPAIVKMAGARHGICGLIKMPGAPILTALANFPDEFARYTSR